MHELTKRAHSVNLPTFLVNGKLNEWSNEQLSCIVFYGTQGFTTHIMQVLCPWVIVSPYLNQTFSFIQHEGGILTGSKRCLKGGTVFDAGMATAQLVTQMSQTVHKMKKSVQLPNERNLKFLYKFSLRV